MLDFTKLENEKEKELIEEIISVVHQVAGHEFCFRSHKRDALIGIRNKIMGFKGKDNALENVVLYLNGFIHGLRH